MNNSSVIVAALFAAFVIVITQRGELPIYLGFILATPKPSGGTSIDASKVISTALPAIIP